MGALRPVAISCPSLTTTAHSITARAGFGHVMLRVQVASILATEPSVPRISAAATAGALHERNTLMRSPDAMPHCGLAWPAQAYHRGIPPVRRCTLHFTGAVRALDPSLGVASREYVLAAQQHINIKPKFHTSGAGTARH